MDQLGHFGRVFPLAPPLIFTVGDAKWRQKLTLFDTCHDSPAPLKTR
jgi:hypothetical protein